MRRGERLRATAPRLQFHWHLFSSSCGRLTRDVGQKLSNRRSTDEVYLEAIAGRCLQFFPKHNVECCFIWTRVKAICFIIEQKGRGIGTEKTCCLVRVVRAPPCRRSDLARSNQPDRAILMTPSHPRCSQERSHLRGKNPISKGEVESLG